jgi:hypothetical protein
MTGASAFGQGFWVDHFAYSPGSGVYGPHEFSFDILGGYATRDKGGADKDAFGIGAGLNYFFFENIGVGVDTYADAFEAPYLLNFSGIYRYPFRDLGLAPYGFGGFGRQWEHDPRWTGHIGAGVEYRFNQKTGLFLDGRGVFGGEDYALWRLGFRFAF